MFFLYMATTHCRTRPWLRSCHNKANQKKSWSGIIPPGLFTSSPDPFFLSLFCCSTHWFLNPTHFAHVQPFGFLLALLQTRNSTADHWLVERTFWANKTWWFQNFDLPVHLFLTRTVLTAAISTLGQAHRLPYPVPTHAHISIDSGVIN